MKIKRRSIIMIEKKLILCFIAMIIIIISIASAENYNCDEDFRRLTSAAAQPGAYDDRDAGEGLMLDVNPGSSAKSKVAYGIKGPVGPPIPNAVDFRKIGNQNKDQLFHLRSNLEIPDEGEMTVQIDVKDDTIVDHLEVDLRGLYHEHASDLKITLKHISEVHSQPTVPTNTTPIQTEDHVKSLEFIDHAECILVNQRQGSKFYGTPDPHPHPNIPTYLPGQEYPEPNRVRGVGYNYLFTDIKAKNIAFNKTAKQSSTKFGGVASKAVDGITNGHYAQGSVTHTAGHKTHVVMPGSPIHAVDPEAWWQVDLGSTQPVGGIKLWNRIQEDNVDEIQLIRTHSAGVLTGKFKLSFNYSGVVYTTDFIYHNAVAKISDEVQNGLEGNGIGESMQAKLQGVAAINTVLVERTRHISVTAPSNVMAYDWTVTFVSEPGNLNQLAVAQNSLLSQGGSISTVTIRNGNANVWYNYKYGMALITGRLTPSWVLVLNEDVNASNLTYARSKALWSKRITVDKRETALTIRTPIQARYIRIQLESTKSDGYLSIAEVQVFQEASSEIQHYRGGSPIVGGTYQSEESLDENFRGIRARGLWILSIRDLVRRNTVDTMDSRPSYDVNGRGAIDDWTLTIRDTENKTTIYHMDIFAEVKTLPTYGRLFIYNEKWKARGKQIGFVKGQHQLLGNCYGNCRSKFSVGNKLSTLISGSMADINILDTNRYIVYAPNRDFLGMDTFSYTIRLGVLESKTTGVVTLDTRICRQNFCLNEAFNDGIGYMHQQWYRKELESLLSSSRFVRQAELLRTMRPSGSRL
jgi:hypothetical protein